MADMRDFERQQRNERSGGLGDVIKVAAVAGLGYAAVKNRHAIASPIMDKLVKSQRFNMAGEIMGESFSRGKTFVDALGSKPGAMSFARALRAPDDFERRARLSFRAQQAARSQENQLKEAPLMAKRVLEHISSTGSVEHEAIRHIRGQAVKEAIRANKTLQSMPGLEELLTYEGMLGKKGHTEQGIRRFVMKHSSEEARKTQNFHLDLEKLSKEKQSEFVDELFKTLDETSSRIALQKNKDTGEMVLSGSMSIKEQTDYKKTVEVMKRTQFEALVKGLDRKRNESFFNESMKRNGYDMMTLGDLMDGEFDHVLEKVKPIIRKGSERKKLDFVGEILENAKRYGYKEDEIRGLVVDSHWVVNRETKHMLDATGMQRGMDKSVDFIHQNFQVPFLNFNPIDLFQYGSFKASREAPLFRMFSEGQMSGFANANYSKMEKNLYKRNDGAKQTPFDRKYLYAGGASYDLEALVRQMDEVSDVSKLDLKKGMIEDDLVLVSSEFGVPKRFTESYANMTEHDGEISWFRDKIWGGKQENESVFGRLRRGFSKSSNPDYGPNLLYRLREANSLDEVHEIFNKMNSVVSRGTRGMSHDMRYAWADELREVMNKSHGVDIDFHLMAESDDYALDIAQQVRNATLGAKAPNTPSGRMMGGAQGKLYDLFKKYEQDQALFVRQKTTTPNKAPISDEMINIAAVGYDRMVSQTEQIRQSVEQIALASYQVNKGRNIDSFLDEMYEAGRIGQEEIRESRDLMNTSLLDEFRYRIQQSKSTELEEEALLDFQDMFMEQSAFDSMLGTLKRKDPWYGAGPGDDIVEHYGDGVHFHMIKSHRGFLQSINEQLASTPNMNAIDKSVAIAKGAQDYFGSVFASNKNMDNVTTGTMVPWFFASRLDDAMSQLGLGLGNKYRGSAAGIIFNQWGRRVVLPYVAYQQAMYLDGLTGDFVSDQLSDAYVNMHEDVAGVKDFMGINQTGKSWSRVFAGGDQIGEWIPNKLLNFATFGAFSDFRSQEEVEDYYVSGEDPIRKGRYWGIGSTTPWMGGKIERWQPNWYRRVKSDYKFSDNAYGSEEEYFENHWMPTLTNPLAPLRHFFFDRYHYENKHRDERPFAVTGGFAELDNIPLVGPLVDDTIGRIIKPRREDPRLRKAHREYLEAYNERLASAYTTANSGATLQSMPSGGYNVVDDEVDVVFGDGGGFSEEGMYVGDVYQGGGTGDGSGGGTIVSGTGAGAQEARAGLMEMNANITASSSPIARGIGSLEDMRDPMFPYDLSGVLSRDSLTDLRYGSYRDVWYNASEIAGIFGFATKASSGFEEGGRGPTLQDSGLMSSYNRAFWDMELGGLGGDISEITRRYLARDPNKNYYNPIRNTMPEWMPGAEYFVDFKHGDPYSRVNAGLMRLPGDAYEKLYNVKKDEFGNYSALDRLRILGDVAPYSDQYRMARKQVSLLNQHGMLTEDEQAEYKTMREQVSKKKEKKLMYDRRFRDADVITETVTVTKVLDANTFVTREYGEDNPLKLAGVQVKNSDEETMSFVRQFIYEGAELKVALDADPMKRQRDDLMNTMRAVVYTNHNEEGNPFYLTTKGSNLNFMLANRASTKDKVTIRDDGSAIATAALFSDEQITVGKMYDSLVRDILPQVPIVGVFADKFLQVRSPVESYRRELYGKAWRDWASPWSGWIEPMMDTMASRNPIIAAAEGYGIGYMFGRNRSGGVLGMGLGMTVGLMSTMRVINEIGNDVLGSDRASVPARREKEREVDEYFDRLKYVKYHGLYKRASQLALEYEGFDVEDYVQSRDEDGRKNKGLKKYIEDRKKWLSIQKKSGYGNTEELKAELKEHNQTLSDMNEYRPEVKVGPYAALALRYKQEMEATIFSSYENADFQALYRALPSKDREYFTKFMEASPRDRKEILRLVPEYQRPIYQRAYGLEMDKQESMLSYFRDHYLPSADWEGWRAEESLDAVKIKVMKNEGLELTEANFWDDDEQRSRETDIKAVPIRQGMGRLDAGRLEKALRGAGLKDVQVTMSRVQSDQPGVIADLDLMMDRNKEVLEYMRDNWTSLLS